MLEHLPEGFSFDAPHPAACKCVATSPSLGTQLRLDHLVQTGEHGLLRTLLERKADPNWPRSEAEWSPLHLAIEARNQKAVELLLEAKADTACPGAKKKGNPNP